MKKGLCVLGVALVVGGSITACNLFSKETKESEPAYLSGEGAPSVSIGVEGKYYYDTQNKDLYYKLDGKWVFVSNLEVTNRLKEGEYVYSKDGVTINLTIDNQEKITKFIVTGKDGYDASYKIKDHFVVVTFTKDNTSETLNLGVNGQLSEQKIVLVEKYDKATSEKLIKTFTGKDINNNAITFSFTIEDETNATLVYKDANGTKTYKGNYEFVDTSNENMYDISIKIDSNLFIIGVNFNDASQSELKFNPLSLS